METYECCPFCNGQGLGAAGLEGCPFCGGTNFVPLGLPLSEREAYEAACLIPELIELQAQGKLEGK